MISKAALKIAAECIAAEMARISPDANEYHRRNTPAYGRAHREYQEYAAALKEIEAEIAQVRLFD